MEGISSPADSFNLGMQQIPYARSSPFPQQLQPQPPSRPTDSQILQMLQRHRLQPDMLAPLTAEPLNAFPEMLQNDHLGRFRGLNVNPRDTHLMNPEVIPISYGESISN